jgi:hypothetical protein
MPTLIMSSKNLFILIETRKSFLEEILKKMAQNHRHLTDTYKEGFCCVCGLSDVNQYYGINESYIDYCGNFHTLKEILVDMLNVNVRKT